jgi:hypothetical protein
VAETENTRGLGLVPLLRARVPFNWEDLAVVEVTIPAGLGDDDLGGGWKWGSARESQSPIIRIPVHSTAWELRCRMAIIAHPRVVGHWKRISDSCNETYTKKVTYSSGKLAIYHPILQRRL